MGGSCEGGCLCATRLGVVALDGHSWIYYRFVNSARLRCFGSQNSTIAVFHNSLFRSIEGDLPEVCVMEINVTRDAGLGGTINTTDGTLERFNSLVAPHVSLHLIVAREPLAAHLTLVWPLPRVQADVDLVLVPVPEQLAAVLALVRLLTSVVSAVHQETLGVCKPAATHLALIRRLLGVGTHVAGEARLIVTFLSTYATDVGPVSIVYPHVYSEAGLVGVAVGAELTLVGTLSCVHPHVKGDIVLLSESLLAHLALVRSWNLVGVGCVVQEILSLKKSLPTHATLIANGNGISDFYQLGVWL